MKYKGFVIEHNENTDQWNLFIDGCSGVAYSHISLKNVKKYADKIAKKDFKRFNVLVADGYYRSKEFIEKTVTSIDDAGAYWCVDKDGDREKENVSNIYVLSDKNKEIIKQMKYKRISIQGIEEEIEKLLAKMDKIKEEK